MITVSAAERLAAVQEMVLPFVVPAGASHLVGLGRDEAPDLLRHAVKIDTVATPEIDALPGDVWTRWLVWLGAARPPGPPSHLRFGRLDGGEPAGLLLPYTGGAPLTIGYDAGRRTVVTDQSGPRWQEVACYTGQPVAEQDWRLAGWTAAIHHEQRLAPSGLTQSVLIVRSAGA